MPPSRSFRLRRASRICGSSSSKWAVKGKAAAIVQDAESYQRLLDIAARADAREGIRQGLEEAEAGKGRNAEEFFADFEAAHGISG
jgi:hypothetical protein